MTVHCIERYAKAEPADSDTLLTDFRHYKGQDRMDLLLGGADIAMLVRDDSFSCSKIL